MYQQIIRRELSRSIKEILMERDGLSADDADDIISQAQQDLNDRLAEGETPFDICSEWFGLEPDYIMELV